MFAKRCFGLGSSLARGSLSSFSSCLARSPIFAAKATAFHRAGSTNDSFISGSSRSYIEEMYIQWRSNPASVHKSWDVYFRSGQFESPPTLVADYAAREEGSPVPVSSSYSTSAMSDVAKVLQLVRAFQVRGHLLANIDPLGLMKPRVDEDLKLESYGFTEKDLDREVDMSVLDDKVKGFLSREHGKMTIGHIYQRLKETYCGNIGYEYMHIPNVEECNWLRHRIETRDQVVFSADKKKQILERLMWADHMERFLAQKFNLAKRFGLEGGETTIPGMKAMMDKAAELGVSNIVMGMPHRGRLNVLSSVIKKPIEQIFCEFSGGRADEFEGSGDVKYHLGMSLDRPAGPKGTMMHLTMLANPSHLEAVNPVVCGKARAKQFYTGDKDRKATMGVLLHGDAAFAGQGVVYETFGMSKLPAYTVGGVIHIVVNNQIGFTTDPSSARSSPYATDLAKAFNCPVFHVNGNDPEAVVHVSELAAEWRQKYGQDVVIDLVCYRKHGHNEMDEPAFTQPVMYRKVRSMTSSLDLYQERLVKEGVITTEEVKAMSKRIMDYYEEKFTASKSHKPKAGEWLAHRWQGFKGPRDLSRPVDTGVATETLHAIGEKISTVPADFTLHPRLKIVFDTKRKNVQKGYGIDWATAEGLAFGSLLKEGFHVRLSGQDVERGTFSHRHAVVHDFEAETRKTYTPLDHVSPDQAPFSVSNSHLSEYGVLGFELGYSLESPNALVMWEAQFGDFANGAQIIIDQFLSSGEDKWLRQSGLVMLLPHGYEGQGPEHSSARLERFLQLSSDDPFEIPKNEGTDESLQVQQSNWQVVNCTTPANYFHVLRRQMYRSFRKPLIVMSPKSLLRHRLATSKLSEMGPGTRFQRVIPEPEQHDPKKVRRLVFCSGKVYVDLLQYKLDHKITDVAIARVEQISPFPFSSVAAEANRWPNAEIVWCQEEPLNQGAWQYVEPRIETALKKLTDRKQLRPRYIGRSPSAASATGYAKIHEVEQAAMIEKVFA